MTIAQAAMLTELNISVWTAAKKDRGATIDVLARNNAHSADAASVRKNLMAGTSARKEIADFAAATRNWHSFRTLPWSDKGQRLLPVSLFFDYTGEMNARKQQFEFMVDKFVQEYDTHIAAARAVMGDLFDEDDYPPAEEVRHKFAFRFVVSPVPEAGDFRIELEAADMERLKSQYDAAFNDRLAEAVRTPWEQLHGLITRMLEKLNKEDDPDTKRRWHDTFITNVYDMCQLLEHINLTNDPKLEQARLDMRRVVDGTSIEAIREDEHERAELRDKLTDVLKNYTW